MDRPTPEFTQEQEEWLCWQIGEWYLEYKHLMVRHKADCPQKCSCSHHILGMAKEMLKLRLCSPLDDERNISLQMLMKYVND